MNSIQTTTAFCWNQQPLMHPPSVLQRQHYNRKFAASNTVCFDYDDASKHHTITIPSFLSDDSDISGVYPSLLHKIHVLPFLEQEETSRMLQIASDYAKESQSWDQQDSTRHVSYQTVDFAIEESHEMFQYMQQIDFQDRIFRLLSEEYDVDADDLSFLDLFCASYEAKRRRHRPRNNGSVGFSS